ncbi:SIMPL domain-containing protein [Bacillus shivajii]|uniref:SIMPL domain-containing protein n=1 Tax=Bacillus shivajii TaxID=1983719 RepID=UPI001CFC2DA4|nr:SIMPL domain-containing protein [Bacillus shivajii]UCZ54002.1 SIMPL domain-containing protein [Bacillus shivajii]
MYYQPQFRHAPPAPRVPVRNNSNNHSKRTLVVFGKGIVSAQPDEAKITVGVITEGRQLQEVQQENAQVSSQVIASLTELGIPEANIQTVEYRVDMQYDYIDGKQVFRGYRVTHQFQITIDQIDETGVVVDTAVASGANTVSNIQFTLKDPSQEYNDALRQAIQQAENKANVMADEQNISLNPVPEKIEELREEEAVQPFQPMLFATAEATPIQPGTLQITARVKMTYSY